MSKLRTILAEEGITTKSAGSRLDVWTNAYTSGARTKKFKVTISQGNESISATLDEWQNAIQKARDEIRQAEWEY